MTSVKRPKQIDLEKDEINKIIHAVQPILKKCKDALENKENTFIFSVDDRRDLPDIDKEFNSKAKYSIYYFEALIPNGFPSTASFIDAWNNNRKLPANESFPKVNEERAKKVKVGETSWVPFYLGKSEKGLKTRLKQHIEKTSKRTGALKLSQSPEFFKSWKFRLSVIELGDIKYGPSMLALIEALLREELDPIIGDQ